MDHIPLETRSYVFFQQDGVPAYNIYIYNHILFKNICRVNLEIDGWVHRGSSLAPQISGPYSIRFFFVGTFDYSTSPLNIQDLKDKILNTCSAELQREQILAATQMEVMCRLQSCMENDGLNVEQFLR